jgi:hypothetical protein
MLFPIKYNDLLEEEFQYLISSFSFVKDGSPRVLRNKGRK